MVYPAKIDHAAVVATARRIIEREGIPALSIRHLSALLNVQVPAVYRHVEDKQTLLRIIALEAARELAMALSNAISPPSADAAAQLRALAVAYRRWASDHRHLYLLLAGNVSEPDVPGSEATQIVLRPLREVLTRLAGDRRAPAATQACWAFLHGYLLLEALGQIGDGDPATFVTGIDALARGFSD